ncbi:stage III sporulation protein AF [Paenibacillus sp. NFR01]|uniref:stage III sporulation protein AF n=1 Tax=Paenibacillus sp. NFR01 TaxID=1566279 RepID=UPI0008C0E252|nr:stage III sporulation protein AF [Paenibacillus sp. NFR01]SET57518.1 stage III sporulation protein AF [Paenibacillus sp. NFR01]
MTWLGDWLRELILVVLMAAFVEMLLPGKSMERYARLVLSLLVLLTMLNPVISLLKGDASKELGLALAEQEKSAGGLAGAGGSSLEKILADGRMLAAGVTEQSLQLAAEEVAGQMKESIASGAGIRGAKVTVTLRMKTAASGEETPVIAAVDVALPDRQDGQAADAGEEGSGGSAPIVIEPVKPVQIHVGGDDDGTQVGTEAEGGDGAAAASGSPAAAGDADSEAVAKLLAQNWNLDPDTIQVRKTGGGAGKL